MSAKPILEMLAGAIREGRDRAGMPVFPIDETLLLAETIDTLIKLRIEQALLTNAAIGPEVIDRIRKAWDA